jgi:hypothetical protein
MSVPKRDLGWSSDAVTLNKAIERAQQLVVAHLADWIAAEASTKHETIDALTSASVTLAHLWERLGADNVPASDMVDMLEHHGLPGPVIAFAVPPLGNKSQQEQANEYYGEYAELLQSILILVKKLQREGH